jgi:ribosomal protein S18 acetylase RimI-like enzyme
VSTEAVEVTYQVVDAVTEELVAAVNGLLPQLSSSVGSVSAEELHRLVAWPGLRLIAARLGSQIVGMLTLVVAPLPTGVRAWIEDVVVDEAARGRGIGAGLTREAIRFARRDGAGAIDLTSNPGRAAANRLYQSLGFRLRPTNAYRLDPDT